MKFKQVGPLRSGVQAGFTLVELIVVIVILGILAATALPKFATVDAEARVAKAKGGRAAVQSAVAMYHGKWMALGSLGDAAAIDGVTMTAEGYPTFDAAGIMVAAGLTADYAISTTKIVTDSVHTDCGFTYTATSGAVGNAPVTTNCD